MLLQKELRLLRDIFVEIFEEIPNLYVSREKTNRSLSEEIEDIMKTAPGAMSDSEVRLFIERLKRLIKYLSRFTAPRIEKDTRLSPEVCKSISDCVKLSDSQPFKNFDCLQQAIEELHKAVQSQKVLNKKTKGF